MAGDSAVKKTEIPAPVPSGQVPFIFSSHKLPSLLPLHPCHMDEGGGAQGWGRIRDRGLAEALPPTYHVALEQYLES